MFFTYRLHTAWTFGPNTGNTMSLQRFWALNVVVPLLSMQGQKALGFHQKYLNLCCEDEQMSYGFGTTWGWVINDRIFIFGWTIPLLGLARWCRSASQRTDFWSPRTFIPSKLSLWRVNPSKGLVCRDKPFRIEHSVCFKWVIESFILFKNWESFRNEMLLCVAIVQLRLCLELFSQNQ